MGFWGNMELNKRTKLSLVICLALMSKDISFARYTIKQAYNKSVYTIKTKDGDIDYTFEMGDKGISDYMLPRVMQKVLSERFPTRRVPRMDELDDNMIIKKFTDIVNTFVVEPKDKGSLEYVKYHEDLINLQNNLMTICDMAEDCNILNDEVNLLTSSLFMLDNMILKNSQTGQLSNKADTTLLLDTCLNGGQEAMESIYEEYPWGRSRTFKDSDPKLEKEIARLITYCMLCKDTVPNLDINERMDNVMQYSVMFSNGQSLRFSLSNRDCEEKDFREFKDKVYDEILCRNGFTDTSIYAPEDKEAFVMAVIKQNIDHNKNILYSFKKCIEDHVMNFGRDSKIFSSVALNLLDVFGENEEEYPDGMPLENNSCASINKLFDRNYDKLSQDPLLAYKMLTKFAKKHSAGGIRDYLQSKYPDAEIKEITVDNLEDLPPELADLIAGTMQQMIGKVQEDYDPTINYPYPDEEEMNDDDGQNLK